MSQDEIKILIQILNALTFHPKDAKDILNILSQLEEKVKEPEIEVPIVTISPDNIKVKIEKVKK